MCPLSGKQKRSRNLTSPAVSLDVSNNPPSPPVHLMMINHSRGSFTYDLVVRLFGFDSLLHGLCGRVTGLEKFSIGMDRIDVLDHFDLQSKSRSKVDLQSGFQPFPRLDVCCHLSLRTNFIVFCCVCKLNISASQVLGSGFNNFV